MMTTSADCGSVGEQARARYGKGGSSCQKLVEDSLRGREGVDMRWRSELNSVLVLDSSEKSEWIAVYAVRAIEIMFPILGV